MIRSLFGKKKNNGFTITELVVVVSIIGILATISFISYSNWKKNTIISQLKSDLNSVSSAMENYKNFNNGYPSSVPSTFSPSDGVTLSGGSTDGGKTYCVSATNSKFNDVIYHVTDSLSPTVGACAG